MTRNHHGQSTWYRCDFALTEVAARRLFNGEPHSGNGFRQLMAKLADEESLGLPPAAFNYDAAGSPLQALPMVRFAGYARGVSVVGVSPEGVALARAIAPTILATLTRKAGALIKVNERSGVVGFKPTPMPIRYFTPAAALSPTPTLKKWLGWLQEAKDQGKAFVEVQEAREAVARVIEAALVRQMDWLDPVGSHLEEQWEAGSELRQETEGADTATVTKVRKPARTHWGLLTSDDDEMTMVRRAERPFTVTVHGCGKHFFESRLNASALELQRATGMGPKSSLAILGLKQLEFSVNAELDGVWQIGRRTSSGYGMVMRSGMRGELAEAGR